MHGGAAVALGSVFRTQSIGLGQIPYSNGQTVGLEIPKGLLLKALKLRLSGTVTIAGGGAGVTSLFSEHPLTIIKRLELTADGRKPFVSTDPRMLVHRNLIDRSTAGMELSPIGGTLNGTYAFTAYFSVDPALLRTGEDFLSWIDTRLYDGLKLNVTWGGGADVAVLGGNTLTVNAGTVLDVIGEYTTEGFESVLFNRLMISDEIAVTAVQSDLKLAVPRNGLLYSVGIRATNDGMLTNALINNVSLVSENTVRHADRLNWNTQLARNAVDFQFFGGLPYTGYFYHELIENLDPYTALDTTSLNTLDLRFDVNNPAGTNKLIKVLYTFLEPAGR